MTSSKHSTSHTADKVFSRKPDEEERKEVENAGDEAHSSPVDGATDHNSLVDDDGGEAPGESTEENAAMDTVNPPAVTANPEISNQLTRKL
jgi:hypothetical protein